MDVSLLGSHHVRHIRWMRGHPSTSDPRCQASGSWTVADEGNKPLLRLAPYGHLDGEFRLFVALAFDHRDSLAPNRSLTCPPRQYFITFLSSLSFFPVSIYLSTYVDSLASSLSATTVLAVFNAASVVGQVGIGWCSDKYDKAWIIAGLGIGSALTAYTAWGFADTLAKVFGFCILYVSCSSSPSLGLHASDLHLALLQGIFSSICSTWNAAARDVAGESLKGRETSSTEELTLSFAGGDLRISTTVFSLFGIFRGIASIVGPMIAASLYDETKRNQDE